MAASDELRRLRDLTGVKWSWFDEDVIPAWVADMDFSTAPPVIDALRKLSESGDTGYSFSAHQKIPALFAERSERLFGWRPDPEEIRVFTNVLQPVTAALATGTKPGDGVVLFTPVYPPFFAQIEKSGRRVVECRLDPNGWRLDEQTLRAAVDPGTRAILMCNPHNPTGRAFDREELGAVLEVAEEHDLLVISDEIWQDLVYPGATHIPFSSLGPAAEARTVTATAASKTFNLGGMSCGVAHFGSAAVRQAVAELPPHLLGSVSAFGARATVEAWTHGHVWLAEVLAQLEANRDHLASRIAAELPHVGMTLPEATYVAWLDLRALDLGPDPAERILEKGRVALSKGPDFGEAGEGFARLNFATYPEILDEIVERLIAGTV